jgi:hypothetical protein
MNIWALVLIWLACLVDPVQAWRWGGHRGQGSKTCGQIVGFRLVHATTGAVISDLKNGTVVYLNDTNLSLTVVAVPDRTKGPISKVQMGWNRNARYRIETVEPYTLCGGTSYAPCKGLGEGVHKISVEMPLTSQAADSSLHWLVTSYL